MHRPRFLPKIMKVALIVCLARTSEAFISQGPASVFLRQCLTRTSTPQWQNGQPNVLRTIKLPNQSRPQRQHLLEDLDTIIGEGNQESAPLTYIRKSRKDYQRAKEKETAIINVLPVLAAIVSFFTFPITSSLFHDMSEALSANTWTSVDGGKLQADVLIPVLNGVVMVAISLLYANLITTTGLTLRNRQNTVHQYLNKEAEGVRELISLVEFFPQQCQDRFRSYLKQYVYQVVDEFSLNIDPRAFRSKSEPMSLFRSGLHSLSAQPDVNSIILAQSYDAVQRLTSNRSGRITALQSTFPVLHYVNISVLTLTFLVIFLIETDRDLILFLNNFQLRLVWSIFIGTFTAIYCIGYDLSNPFTGTYQIPEIVDTDDVIFTLFDDTSSPDICASKEALVSTEPNAKQR